MEKVSYDRQSVTLGGGDVLVPDSASGEPPSRRDRITFAEAAHLYVAAGGEARYLSPLVALLGERFVDKIAHTDIEHTAEKICGRLSPATRNRRVYTPISAVLKFSARQGWCEYRRIRRPASGTRGTSLPTPEEVNRFINAAGPSLRRILIFLIGTGRPVRETLRLDWRQVSLAHATVQIRNPRGHVTTVALPPRVVEMMARFLHRAGKVFRRPDGAPYSEMLSAGGQLKKAIEGAQRRSGVKITPRMLRHIWRSRNGED